MVIKDSRLHGNDDIRGIASFCISARYNIDHYFREMKVLVLGGE